ncbi:MAG: S8 family serine peptidase, partial [bacterium]|nr:S8 family serine peptidase [bacterium]
PAIHGKGNFPTSTVEAFNYKTDFDKTSASAPMVTGVAALIKAIKPGLTPAQIKQVLQESADPIFAPIGSDEAGKLLGSGCTATSTPSGQVQRGCRLNAEKGVCHPLVLNCAPPALPTSPFCDALTETIEVISQDTVIGENTVCIITSFVSIIIVNPGVTLTLEQGAIIKFQSSGSSFFIGGTLVGQGTLQNPVVITSIHDDIGGNHDNAQVTPNQGNWRKIFIESGGVMNCDNCIVRYGGFRLVPQDFISPHGAIIVNQGRLSFSNSRLTNNFEGHIIQINGGTTTITSSELDASGFGVFHGAGHVSIADSRIHHSTEGVVAPAQLPSSLTIANTEFHDTVLPLSLSPEVDFVHSNTNAHDNSTNAIVMEGLLSSNRTWTKDLIPYVIRHAASTSVFIAPDASLTINPGVIVKFASPFSSLSTSGTLNVNGTSGEPVFFTSVKDDTIGGDTNNDGNTTHPEPQGWYRMNVFTNGTANLNHLTLRYAGASFGPFDVSTGVLNQGGITILSNSHLSKNATRNILNREGTTTIMSSEIDNASIGIEQSSGSVTVNQSSIHGNTSFGVSTQAPAITKAKNNWWGSLTGPFHALLNATGTGNPVSDNVDFIPFLASDPVGVLP